MTWYLRIPGLVAATSGTSCLFVVPGGESVRLDGVDVEALAALLERVSIPVDHAEVEAEVEAEVLTRLVELGVLLRGPRSELEALTFHGAASPATKPCKHVVVGLSGAISVLHALPFLISLADHVAEHVDVIVSDGAARFVNPEAFAYHGLRVWRDPFTPAHGVPVPHAHLASIAELVLVAPASASMLHKLATGACSDLIGLVVAATRAPVVIAPSTNFQMWQHPPVQRNVAQLRADGHWVIEPWRGVKAAARQELGVGILGFDPQGLLRTLDALLQERPSKNARSQAGSSAE